MGPKNQKVRKISKIKRTLTLENSIPIFVSSHLSRILMEVTNLIWMIIA